MRSSSSVGAPPKHQRALIYSVKKGFLKRHIASEYLSVMCTKLSILTALVVCVSAAPQKYQPGAYQNAVIIALDSDVKPDGSFTYSYQSDDGQSAQVRGTMKNAGSPDHEAQSVEGQYSYVGLDGVQYSVSYIADEDGFRAFGAHLPTPPPIPDDIQRSLDFNARNPEPKEEQTFRGNSQPIQLTSSAPAFTTQRPFRFPPFHRFEH